MTIYEMPIPQDIERLILTIINKRGFRDASERQKDNAVLVNIYLRYVEPHQWQPNEKQFEPTVSKWLSCGRCINKVCEYFEKRYENE